MQPYIIYIHPEASDSKLPEFAVCIQARTEFLAKAQAMSMLENEFPETAFEYAEPLSCADRPGLDRPKMNVLDAEFMKTHVWNEETQEIQPLAEPEEKSVNFDALPSGTKMAILVRFGTTKITSSQLKDAMSLAQDEANSFEGHMVEALSRTKSIAAMHPEIVLELISDLGNSFEPGDNWPQMKAFIERWQKDRLAARKDSSNVTPLRTASGVKAGGSIATDRSPDLTHNHDSLGLEIAAALLPFEFDIYQIPAAVYRRAKEMVTLKEQDWAAWNRAMIATPGILDYSRAAIMHCVRTAPENIHLTAGALQQHINKTLTETDHANPLPEIVAIACGQQIDNPRAENDETKPNDEGEESALADAEITTGAVEPDTNEPDGAASGVADVPPVIERTGPFYARNEAGEVKRCNKQKALEPLLAQGYTEITKDEYLQLKNKPASPATPPTETAPEPDQNKPIVNDLGNGRFSIEGLILTQNPAPQPTNPAPSNEVEKQENDAPAPSAETFQSIAAALEKDLADIGDNMKIWRSVMRTDPRYTKELAGAGFEGTSINAEYMIMRATEIFGPVGTGWGYEVVEDRMLPGAPMSEAIYEDKKFIGNRILRDGDGTLITEQNHSIKIKFWYAIECEVRGEVEAYGATKYLYKTKHGITCDGEAQKKSLTDAIKKALSLLGFSADVWLGLYDQAEYKAENALEFDIRNASDKAEDVTRIRKELDEKFKANTESMRTAVTPNEVSGIASSLTRVMGIHLKAAREKADTEYAKYLEGRLRRLEEVKAECLTKLQENAA
ncbi:exodeoxyribonuclease VIII [Pantoea agglomerans]|uniref:exodeoxyribonuclease VIII n=1 Tax=Enterobacter agglomerans TaxID=549 RepID=UPI003C7C9D56